MPLVRSKASESGGVSQAIALSTAGVTVFTFSTGLLGPDDAAAGYGGIIDELLVYSENTGTTRNVDLYLISATSTAAAKHRLCPRFALGPQQGIVMRPVQRAKDSAYIVGVQDAGTDVYVRAAVSELH